MDYKTLFSQTPPTRLFFKAAIPGSIGMLASALYQVADGIFISRILGDTAFAGFNLAMPLVIINFALADLIGLGSAVPISIKLGSKDEKEANNYFTCASIMVVLAGILSGAVLALGGRTFLSWMGAQGELLDQATAYLVTYALCSPVTTIVFAVDNYLRICGKIRRSMILNIFMSVACMGFELLFMGVLKIGIRGAALGSSLGMALTAIAAFVPFFLGKMQLRFVRPRFHAKALREIVSCGLPSFLNNIAGRVTSIIMNVVLLAIGGQNAVSVYGILMTMDGFVHPLLYGMCDSLQPAVGFNWGARNIKRVKAIELRCYTAAIILALATTAVLALFPRQIAGLFITGDSDPAYLEMAVSALLLFSLTYITRWFSFATQSFLSAIEKPVAASAISVCTALVFPVILIGVFWPLGLTGLWLNFAGTAVLAGILALILLLRQKELWKKDGTESA